MHTLGLSDNALPSCDKGIAAESTTQESYSRLAQLRGCRGTTGSVSKPDQSHSALASACACGQNSRWFADALLIRPPVRSPR